MPSEQKLDGAGGDQGAAPKQNTFSSVLLPVLAAIGTGIGVLGFVIFFGGFVVWARFDAVGLPGNEAAARVPRSDLVTTGASFLVPALLVALVAAAGTVALWDFVIGRRRREREGNETAQRMRADSNLKGLLSKRERLTAKATGLEQRLPGVDQRQRATPPDSSAFNAMGAERNEMLRDLQQVKHGLENLDKEIPAAEERQAAQVELATKPKKSTPREWLLQLAVGGGSMLLAEIIVVSFGFIGLTRAYQLLVLATMAATILVAIVVISMTDHFAWFTVCVFLGVGITVAASTYARTQSHVKISPAALLDGSNPVAGYFVAETGDAVYLGAPPQPQRTANGQLKFDNQKATLVRVPNDSISGLTVGPIMDEADAYRRSLDLALTLCRQAKLATVGRPTVKTSDLKQTQGKGREAAGRPVACAPKRVAELRRRQRIAKQ